MRALVVGLVLALGACGDNRPPGCQIDVGAEAPDELLTVGCDADFVALGYQTGDGSLPGSLSVKIIADLADGGRVHFENTNRFINHFLFAIRYLSGNGLPVIPDEGWFYGTNQFQPERRFIMGDVVYYTRLDRYVVELAPYDTADAKMIQTLFDQTRAHMGFANLAFHPNSEPIVRQAALLPKDIPIVTTEELYAGIDYQPLSLATSIGRLRITTQSDIAGRYVSYQDLLVLDGAPNDLGVVAGLVTEDFQTPLSHVNILARNRGIPNMGLRAALSNPTLRALDGKLVELVTTGEDWHVREVSDAEAAAWFASHTPAPVAVPPIDTSAMSLLRIADVSPEAAGLPLLASLQDGISKVGGKAAHYAVLRRTPGVPIRDAFAIPLAFYVRFMQDNGYAARIDAMLADPAFLGDPSVRDAQLAQLRTDMATGTLPPSLGPQLQAMIAAHFAGVPKLRFRSSSNSEDLAGFPCPGCYDSQSGSSTDLADMLAAIRAVYASVWTLRAFELRSYYGVDHTAVGMGLLVHESFPGEEANGVAVTRSPLVPDAIPSFYINVQLGESEVVSPPQGVTSDQLIDYFYDGPPAPITYIAHSNLTLPGETVLSEDQLAQLATVLDTIHTRFASAYGTSEAFYGMDVEFKFDDVAAPGQPATCYIKQARPYPDPFPVLPRRDEKQRRSEGP